MTPSPLYSSHLEGSPHVFTVDVEEYFHANVFDGVVEQDEWPRLESRVSGSTRRILELLEEAGARATFFVLGWVADRHPALVREIADAGHEIASHGWWHRPVTRLEPEEFRSDVRRSRERLEEIVGVSVRGYRAPSYSIVPGREWALDILVEEGYRYDSSLFPVRRNGYGYPGGERGPHRLRRGAGVLEELPPATLRVAGVNLPAAGGAYLRHLPVGLTRGALRQSRRRDEPGVLYVHPWELDAEQPRLPLEGLARWRHYGGLGRFEFKVRELLRDFRFTTAAAALGLDDVPAEESPLTGEGA